MENRSLDELMATLREEPQLWLRLAATRADDWRLAFLEITAGEAPPTWQVRQWRYERAVFIATALPGPVVSDWFEKHIVRIEPVELALTDLPTTLQVDRRESRWIGVLEPLPWPTVIWSARLGEPTTHQFAGELVADDAPPFLDFDQGAAMFFAVARTLNRTFGARELVFRAQDRRARISSVRVRPTELRVAVEGSGLEGVTLAIGGDRPAAAERLTAATRHVRLPLAEALPTRAWLALHRDRELLDRRYLDGSWGQSDVEVEVDAETRLAVLLASGEGQHTEFKRELPTGDVRNVRNALKSVAAFANGDGGVIVFGVDDEGAIAGLEDESVRKTIDRLTNLVSDYVRPVPLFEVIATEQGDRRVLLLNVSPSPDTPYGIGTTDRDVVYYLRRSATSYPASPAEVRAMVRARLPANAPFGHLQLS